MRSASGVDLTRLVGNNGEDSGDLAESIRLLGGEAGGEAIDCLFVSIEELGGVRGGREGFDYGGIPVVWGGEEGGFVGIGNVDDEIVLGIRFR